MQTDHFIDDDLQEHNPTTEPWEEGGVQYSYDTYPRQRSLERRLADAPESLEQVVRKLRGSPVTCDNTQHQMVFQPASGFSRVWLRR